jgi:hypothetical protein
MLLASALADMLGLVLILGLSGGLYVLSGVLAWVMLPQTLEHPLEQPASLEKKPSTEQVPVH